MGDITRDGPAPVYLNQGCSDFMDTLIYVYVRFRAHAGTVPDVEISLDIDGTKREFPVTFTKEGASLSTV